MANGTWTVTVTMDEGEKPVTMALQPFGDQLRGTIQGALGSSQISNGSIGADGALKFSATVTMGGGTEEATFTGTIAANIIRGTDDRRRPSAVDVRRVRGPTPPAGGGAAAVRRCEQLSHRHRHS